MQEKIVLSEAKGVYRLGDAVCRPAEPWSANVQALLRHLRQRGLTAPQPLGVNERGEEQIAFVDGERVHPYRWTDEGLYAVGQLVARLHAAAADFRPPDGEVCQSWCLRELGGRGRVWCHGDIAPWNMVTERELPKTLVDWEMAGPLDPLVELARVCWLFPQLVDDDLGALYELPDPENRARQARLVCEGYGLDRKGRAELTQQMLEVVICETAHEAIDPALTFDAQGPLWGFAWRTRSLYWIWRNRALLHRTLTA